MGILDGIVEWIAEQIMYGLDMINTSVLGALGCDMNTFLRYFPAAETMYIVGFSDAEIQEYQKVIEASAEQITRLAASGKG